MERPRYFNALAARRTSLACAIGCAALIACDGTVTPTNPIVVPQPQPSAPPPAPAAPSTGVGSIAGFVLSESNACIIGARVELVDGPQAGAVFMQTVCGFWDYGDDNGYSFHNLPSSPYKLRASADGYESTEISATPSNPYQYSTMIVLKKK